MNEVNFNRRKESFFHLSVRTKDLRSLPLDPEVEFVKINKACQLLNQHLQVKFYAYVYMFDHFHILLSIQRPDSESFKVEFIKASIVERMKQNKVAVYSYLFSPITTYFGFIESYKYIYANPLKDGLCEDLIDYYFSSLSWQLGRRKSEFEVLDVTQLTLHPHKWLYEFERCAAGLV